MEKIPILTDSEMRAIRRKRIESYTSPVCDKEQAKKLAVVRSHQSGISQLVFQRPDKKYVVVSILAGRDQAHVTVEACGCKFVWETFVLR
jgi:hypothetical protein